MEYNNSKRHIWLPLIVVVAIVAGIVIGRSFQRKNSPSRSPLFTASAPGMSNDKLNRVLSLIYNQYVDAPQLDSVEEKIIPILLEGLDPHSDYIPASQLAQVNEPIEGQFDGIGVTFNMLTDTVRIINVINGGPSAKAGIQNGDRIITVGDSIVSGRSMDQTEVVKMLRGPRGTTVDLGIERQGVPDLLPITVTRGVIPMKSVDAGFMIDPQTGYIKLSLFSRNSHQEIVQIGTDMKKLGMKNLILDLQGNSGGLLDQAIYIANELLPKDALIVYTEGRASKRRNQYSNGEGRLQDLNLIVLVNEWSASASEIVAGAIQDNDRGTIIGRRSFGKGLVQEQIPFGDGSAIRLTVARYYTPVGRSIQKPYDDGREVYNMDLQNRFEHSEFFSADSIHFADSLKFVTPGGKTVYGGGGIMPDVFVPADTTPINRYAREVLNRNVLFRYTMSYADKHREDLNQISTLPESDAYFEEHSGLYDDFVRYARVQGVLPKGNDLEESRELLLAELKAYIGRNTSLEDNAFYYYLLPFDAVFVRTKEFLDETKAE